MEHPFSDAIPKRIVAVNDLTGFGRCSLAAVLPVISAMRVQACPVPTSVFSNHMGFPSYYHQDLSDALSPYLGAYETLGVRFDGVYCGFLSAPSQFESALRLIGTQRALAAADRKAPPVVLIDPVMGDLGRPYRIVTKRLCENMRRLAANATILTPNLTEGCMLTDTVYPVSQPSDDFLYALAEKLLQLGPSQVALTGIAQGDRVANYCAERNGGEIRFFTYATPFNGEARPGTGDIFASILAANAVKGVRFEVSVRQAADFIRLCVDASARADSPIMEGVLFEPYLSVLAKPPET